MSNSHVDVQGDNGLLQPYHPGRTKNKPFPLSPRVMTWLYHSFAVAPTVALLSVWTLSWRVSVVTGQWPRPWIDDPKFIAPDDRLVQFLYLWVWPCILWAGLGVWMFPLMVLGIWFSRHRAWFVLVFAFYIATSALMILDPGERFKWFMD